MTDYRALCTRARHTLYLEVLSRTSQSNSKRAARASRFASAVLIRRCGGRRASLLPPLLPSPAPFPAPAQDRARFALAAVAFHRRRKHLAFALRVQRRLCSFSFVRGALLVVHRAEPRRLLRRCLRRCLRFLLPRSSNKVGATLSRRVERRCRGCCPCRRHARPRRRRLYARTRDLRPPRRRRTPPPLWPARRRRDNLWPARRRAR